MVYRKVDARLHGKEDSNTHGTRPVHLIITMIKWIQTSRLSTNGSLSEAPEPLVPHLELRCWGLGSKAYGLGFMVYGLGFGFRVWEFGRGLGIYS